MIYYQDPDVVIRNMEKNDAQIITDSEIEQGWDQTIDKSNGIAISLVAEYQGNVAGYISVYPDSKWGAFGNQGLPEIIDFGVLEKFRNRGVGSKLMDVAERIAHRYADRVYLGVGLHSGYGSAQRMYVKRGYIPDGSGVWYKSIVCPPYCACCNNDDLVLYMIKDFESEKS